jgi:hypothetical protein
MKDTPQHIKAMQLKIWLSKPPMERLRQMMIDNETLMNLWTSARDVKPKEPECNNGKNQGGC